MSINRVRINLKYHNKTVKHIFYNEKKKTEKKKTPFMLKYKVKMYDEWITNDFLLRLSDAKLLWTIWKEQEKLLIK